ncbi:MAG: DegT/DnrJ/EryC1/StrS family aminotransferase [Hymenobacter sp.]
MTTPITFAASANCVRYCGGEVHFADIDPTTGLIDLQIVSGGCSKRHPKGLFLGA